MDPDKRAALDKKLAQLREFYIQGLPAEFAKLEDLLNQLKQDQAARETVSEIHQALHKFAGSGGSFGLPELSIDARKVEQELLQWLKSEQTLFPSDMLEHLHQSIGNLKKLLAAESKQEPEQKANQAEPLASKSIIKRNSTKSKKIWLIEHHKKLYEKLVNELGTFSFDVVPFESVADLSSDTEHLHADLILIDLALLEVDKETNGIALPSKLKEQNVPFLVIGWQEDFNTRLAIAKLGASGYFVTPFDIADIISSINQIFERQAAPPGRVLIVDDDLQLACHYKLVLESADFKVDFVTHPEELLPRMEAFHPELVLMDLNMPDVSGRDLAGVIRQYKRYTSLPIVFLSAETQLNAQLDALFHGADEFLTKPISDEALIVAVHARIQRARTLVSLITKDGLTGLLKHTNIKEMAEYELNRAKRTPTTQCFVMIDIDHFKSVNDTYGHSVGDRVITSLATLLKQRLRNTDLIGRYGGEEFLVVLPECDMQEAYSVMDKIRVLFSKIEFQKEKQNFFCSISIGIACTDQFLRCDTESLINSADKAMYEAKNTGRNKTVMSSASH